MTNQLTLRPAAECRYDALALGEVMLRLDPGEFRIRTARSFTPGRAAASTTWSAASAACSDCEPVWSPAWSTTRSAT